LHDWDTFPPSDFKKPDLLKTHDIRTLLLLAGKYKAFLSDPTLASDVADLYTRNWGEQIRYELPSAYSSQDATDIMNLAQRLVAAL
jgi:HEPN domain-containing protein